MGSICLLKETELSDEQAQLAHMGEVCCRQLLELINGITK